MLCVSLQDYFNALRVTVRGQATLKLITDKPTIRMEPVPTMVRDDDDNNDEDDNDDDDITHLSPPFLVVQSRNRTSGGGGGTL